MPENPTPRSMFTTVLIANRGEIACRVIRTLHANGIRAAVVYTDPDERARHVRDADIAVRVGDYLDIDAVVDAAVRAGAQAVHPGYGFLAENAKFARAVTEAGLTFIGPPAEAIDLMGDKIRAKETVAAFGVPVVPGSRGSGLSDEQLADEARKVGLPVLIKPSAGGGGKGMHLVRDEARLADEIAAARREAAGAFGDDTLLIERWIDRPRHIEVQIVADTHGHVVHFGERECSLQRRHQKIVEEAPSVLLTPAQREAMGTAAVEAARSCGYVGAGTVEFIVPGGNPDDFFFMEMNTRLQVEHPVTEMAVGVDLVKLQLDVAAGLPLDWDQNEVSYDRHAVEVRVYAEDPARGFLPSSGRVLVLHEPELARGDGDTEVRVDSGLVQDYEVGTGYDPMLAKIVACARDRETALHALRQALTRTTVLGVRTNIGFLHRLLADDDVIAGRLDTGLVEAVQDRISGTDLPPGAVALAALVGQAGLEPEADTDGWVDPFSVPSGWRIGAPAPTVHEFRVDGGEPVEVRVYGRGRHTTVAVAGQPAEPAHVAFDGPDTARLTFGGLTETYRHARADDGSLWLSRGADTWRAVPFDPVESGPGAAGAGGDGTLVSPMPGTVTVVKAAVGDRVTAGQAVVVVEAMKMEHAVAAPFDGTVAELRVDAGARVALDEVLAVVHPVESGTASTSDEEVAG